MASAVISCATTDLGLLAGVPGCSYKKAPQGPASGGGTRGMVGTAAALVTLYLVAVLYVALQSFNPGENVLLCCFSAEFQHSLYRRDLVIEYSSSLSSEPVCCTCLQQQ